MLFQTTFERCVGVYESTRYLVGNNLIQDSQHGFWKGKSCTTAQHSRHILLVILYLLRRNNVGTHNPGYKYKMEGTELQEVTEEKDIGILIHQSLKPTKHCKKAADMAGAVLKQITKNFHFRDKNIFKKLYIQYVWPHMEFAMARTRHSNLGKGTKKGCRNDFWSQGGKLWR